VVTDEIGQVRSRKAGLLRPSISGPFQGGLGLPVSAHKRTDAPQQSISKYNAALDGLVVSSLSSGLGRQWPRLKNSSEA
jgi:hypothetical protein